VRPDMVNGHDLCHGGVIASLADSAFALACNSHGPVTVAAGFSIDFLAPGRLGQTLYADASEVSLRGRSGIYDVTVRADDPVAGEVLAEFRGRSRTLPTSASA
jgi:acyl-CoA thioesterase